MESPRAIQNRIKSLKNTSQITKAMEVVSATKMRKSQEFALRARPYAVASFELLHNLLTRTPTPPALFTRRPIETRALLVITSDKGLAGAFNANVIKRAETWVAEKKASSLKHAVIAVGKKAKDHFERRHTPVLASFTGFGDFSMLHETLSVADVVLDGFLQGTFDNVETTYTHFRTTLLQEAVLRGLLPVTETGLKEMLLGILPEHGKFSDAPTDKHPALRWDYEYKFEPSAGEILEELVPELLRMHIHHLILESNASEHSARMVAMKNASESAGELIDGLTLHYNKVRQAGITREITEITAGKEALEQSI